MFAFFYSIFGWLFRILYSFIDNYGLALIIFTLIFRIIFRYYCNSFSVLHNNRTVNTCAEFFTT